MLVVSTSLFRSASKQTTVTTVAVIMYELQTSVVHEDFGDYFAANICGTIQSEIGILKRERERERLR